MPSRWAISNPCVFSVANARQAARGTSLVRIVGHGSSDNAAAFGVYAFALLPGLTAMRERAARAGGAVRAGPTNDGWRVELEVPT